MKKITKDTSLAEILEFPEAEKILLKHNIPCLTCPFAGLEMKHLKIGQICKMYGIDFKSLLKELNKYVAGNQKSKGKRK